MIMNTRSKYPQRYHATKYMDSRFPALCGRNWMASSGYLFPIKRFAEMLQNGEELLCANCLKKYEILVKTGKF